MHLSFDELSIPSGVFDYGVFSGEAELDISGEPVVIELEGTTKDSINWRLDFAELTRERIALRRARGTAFLDSDDAEVLEHLKKWVLFHALSQSLKATFKEEISDYLLGGWSTPPGYKIV